MAAPAIGRRTFKPRSAAVDWSHPLATGLKSLVFPADLVDLVRGVAAATPAGIPVSVATPYGPGAHFNNTEYLDIGQPIKTAGAWTLWAVMRPTTTMTGAGIVVERYTPSNTNCAYTLAVGVTTGTALAVETGFYNAAGSGAWQLATGSALTLGRWYNLASTYAGNAGAINLYYDGVRNATGTGSGADPTPNENTWIGYRHDSSGAPPGLYGDVAVVGIWDRALTANEVAVLAANPFTFLRY